MKVSTTTHEKCPDELIHLYRVVFLDPNNRLADNYYLSEIFKKYTLCCSVTVNESGDPIAGSVVWKKPFYNGAVRLGTRYAIHPNERLHALRPKGENYDYKVGIRPYTVDQLDQQVEFVEALGYTNQFLSREDRRGRFTESMFQGLNKLSKYNWNISPHNWLVCPNKENKACWQKIIYRGEITLNEYSIC